MARDSNAWAVQRARELEEDGATFVQVPDDAVNQATAIFRGMVKGGLPKVGIRKFLHRCTPGGREKWLCFDVDMNAGDDAENCLQYITAADLDTFQALAKPFLPSLAPVLSERFGMQRVVPICGQFILGRQHRRTIIHADFDSPNVVTLITPLFQYTPEQASLHYWGFKENPASQRLGPIAMRTIPLPILTRTLLGNRATYAYQRGEGILFSSDLFHQTAPFEEPEHGWGEVGCRALLAIVLVAVDDFQEEWLYDSRLLHIRETTGDYMVDFVSGKWMGRD